MVSIEWCCRQKSGIKLIEPNDNLASSYLEMAKDSIKVMNNEKDKSIRWAVSSCYYSMYYSLYSVLQKIGIKCEIHACTLELVRFALSNFYSNEDFKLINLAFSCRETVQYYVDRILNPKDSEYILSNAQYFMNKSQEILSKLNQEDIEAIRGKLKPFIKNIR